MTTSEIMVGIEGSKYAALRPESDVREALLANLAPGESISANDLPRVKTPAGGGKMWGWTNAGNNDESAKSIDGILVYYGMRGTLWGTDEISKGVQPVLVSYDLTTAVRVGDDLGDLDPDVLETCRTGDRTYDWTRLPQNQYGSGRNGIGKRCKESRLLAILREGEMWPLLVQAGVGSLKTVCPFVRRLSVPHYRAVVSLTLEKAESSGGIDYSQIVPKLLGTISKEEGELVRKLYTEPLSRIATQFDVSHD